VDAGVQAGASIMSRKKHWKCTIDRCHRMALPGRQHCREHDDDFKGRPMTGQRTQQRYEKAVIQPYEKR
jgi:hypothetical protein